LLKTGGEDEKLGRLTHQGGPFPMIEVGHSGWTNTNVEWRLDLEEFG
jgi:hypothetical protein